MIGHRTSATSCMTTKLSVSVSSRVLLAIDMVVELSQLGKKTTPIRWNVRCTTRSRKFLMTRTQSSLGDYQKTTSIHLTGTLHNINLHNINLHNINLFAQLLCDRYVRAIWWPHYMDKLCNKKESFWTKSYTKHAPKCKHKMYILLVLLPTLLRGFVPAFHRALLTLVYALRLLDGQVISAAEARDRGVTLGSHVLKKSCIAHARTLLILGLVMIEGSFPISHLNPALHHLVHYADMVVLVGCLRWYSMYSFERNNKKVKGLARNGNHALSGVANNIQLDIGTKFDSLIKGDICEQYSVCELVGRSHRFK